MTKQYFELLNLDNDKEYSWEALGISEERFEVLEKELIYEANQDKRQKISQNLAYLAKQCESLEELVYISFAFGKRVSRCSAVPIPIPKHMAGKLEETLDDLLRKLTGREDDEPK